jgi:tryptophan-rich sensory protein
MKKKKNKKKTKVNYRLLIIAIVSVFLTAFIGSQFTSPNTSSDWYQEIKPSITPPNFVFPIVWNVLFLLIAISFYLALSDAKKGKKKVYTVFYINFFLNILWSAIYFGLKNPLFAFIEIILLLISIIVMIKTSYKINKTSAYLLIPYLLWVGFAAILNFLSI